MPSKIKIIIGHVFRLLEKSNFLHPFAMMHAARSSKQRQQASSLRAPKYFPHAQFGKLTLAIILPLAMVLTVIFSAAGAMTEMKDSELSGVSGQALMQMGKTLGDGVNSSSGITFYKAGLDAEVELNMNIDKLQLGCTGTAINGNYCDIDIDKVSLTGSSWGADGRASSSAILTRPFFEFAIKNDNSKTLREVVGMRMSAENTVGMLTLGDQQEGPGDPGNTSGINSLSGYMRLGATSGSADVEPRPMRSSSYTCQAGDPCTGTYAAIGRNMEGRIKITGTILADGIRDFTADSYQLFVTPEGYVDGNVVPNHTVVTVPAQAVTGKRISSVDLQGATASIGNLEFFGNMAADIGITLNKNVTGTISGLTADVPINQSLKFIHKIDVTNSPFSLSMQKNDVLWPGATVAAQAGWWLALENEIDIGSISPEEDVRVTNDVLLQALGPTDISWSFQNGVAVCDQGPSINCSLHTRITEAGTSNVYGVRCDGINACLGGDLPVGNLHVPQNLDFPLSNLKLSGQAVTPNCYGSARFC